jgi:hypothetical protein
MKAFERLEKAEQRRQENQAKQAHRKEHQHDAAHSGTPKKEAILDSKKVSVEVKDESLKRHVSIKPSTADRQKKRRYLGINVCTLLRNSFLYFHTFIYLTD